jgi:hypothetical protein
MMDKSSERRGRLRDLCKRVIDGGPRNVDDDVRAAFKRAVLGYAGNTDQALGNLYQSESEIGGLVRKAFGVIDDAETRKRRQGYYWNVVSPATGAIYPKDRVPDVADDLKDDDDDEDADIVEKSGSGAHDLAGALLRHLQDRLESRREAHGYQKREEGPLDQH